MRFATDENFNGRILSALRKRLPSVDIIRVQDTLMAGASDPELLEWLATENRILLTHDVQTIPAFAYERVEASVTMSGVIVVRETVSIGQIVDELEVIIEVGESDDFKDIVRFVPM
ncbi:MAG: DUF5615 family PIN-like protein [Chloroflexota bacterium]